MRACACVKACVRVCVCRTEFARVLRRVLRRRVLARLLLLHAQRHQRVAQHAPRARNSQLGADDAKHGANAAAGVVRAVAAQPRAHAVLNLRGSAQGGTR